MLIKPEQLQEISSEIDLILDKRIEELKHKKESDEVDREISIAHSILK